MKQFTNVIIIDASGSMTSKLEAVKAGLRDLFKEIKARAKDEPKIKFKTIVVDFSDNHDIRTLVNSSDPKELTNAVADEYKTRGMTALYDAIGYAFKLVDAKQKSVFVNILTDGKENNSKEYNYEKIKSLLTEARGNGWGITFMGTSEEAIQSAISLGMSSGNTYKMSDDSAGITRGARLRKSMSAMYFSSTMDGGAVDITNLATNAAAELDDDALKSDPVKK